MSLIQLAMDALDPTIKCEVDFFQQVVIGTDTTTGQQAMWWIKFPYYADKWATHIKKHFDNERYYAQAGNSALVQPK